MKLRTWTSLLAAGFAAGVIARRAARRRHAIELRGKVVLITGGTRGLGFALAQRFAAEGASVAICARDPAELEAAGRRLARFGTSVMTTECDVGRKDEVELMVQRVLDRFGRVDVLVNNAGIISVGPLEVQTLEDFRRALDVMYWGVVHPTLALLPHMRGRGAGRIANITSIGGKISVPHLLPYGAAKFAAVGFSEGLRAEVAPYGIRVTTVVPGLMRTGSYRNALFVGQPSAEYAWFAIAASLPVLSIHVDRAVERIVDSIRHGDAEIILTSQAKLATILQGLAPGLLTDLMAAVGRLLPGPGARADRQLGREAESAVTRSPLTAAGRAAAERLQ